MDEVTKTKFDEVNKKDYEQDETLKEHERRITELEKSDSKQCIQLEDINKKLDDFLKEFKDSKKMLWGYLIVLLGFLVKYIFFK